ncbi:hypothetical protein HJG60_009164 [Phyllostomus discolor]|uniref:Uncharacterized protein n=1 Tax=Phyllostomus discolor TaxID=89673 RepID=A0A833YPJ0_9CHIR|nr:hypothetical protein HJG60_009164 [Phyllostomus discolor]
MCPRPAPRSRQGQGRGSVWSSGRSAVPGAWLTAGIRATHGHFPDLRASRSKTCLTWRYWAFRQVLGTRGWSGHSSGVREHVARCEHGCGTATFSHDGLCKPSPQTRPITRQPQRLCPWGEGERMLGLVGAVLSGEWHPQYERSRRAGPRLERR